MEPLKTAGIDMSSPEPINAALKLFGEPIEEMEKSAQKKSEALASDFLLV